MVSNFLVKDITFFCTRGKYMLAPDIWNIKHTVNPVITWLQIDVSVLYLMITTS